MNKFFGVCVITIVGGGAGFGIVAARHVPTIKANTYVGPVPVGGLTIDEAARHLRVWWETEKRHTFKLHLEGISQELPDETPGKLGVALDDRATVEKCPTDDLVENVSNAVTQSNPQRSNFDLQFVPNGANLKPLAWMVDKLFPKPSPAKVTLERGQVVVKHESPARQLDVEAVPGAVIAVLRTQGISGLDAGAVVELPVKSAPKHIPDEQVDAITDVVSSFSTRFPARNRPRSSNIKLASSKLNGIILLPGQKLSFNQTVGRRTLKAGFKLAGVYKNGKHDVGIGGGICQVSTTLYNACLYGNLEIRQRSNHSMPVPYVPLGRDATVDYGALDLVVENTYKTPIAVSSRYEPGRLTFRILGKKEPGVTVKVIQRNGENWNPGNKYVIDRRLPAGKRSVIEKGHWGHAVTTYRLIFQDGALLAKQRLGRSFYGGKENLIAVGPSAPAITASVPAVGIRK